MYSYFGYGLAFISFIILILSILTLIQIKMGILSNSGFGDIASMLAIIFSLFVFLVTIVPIILFQKPELSGIFGITMVLFIFMIGPDSRMIASFLMLIHLLLCYRFYLS